MISNARANTNTTAENVLQPVIYQIQPDQSGDEIDLGELFSRLISQWRLILWITVSGCLLALLVALLLPKVYQPSVTLSLPPVGSITPIINVNSLLGNKNPIPATPQNVFKHYYNLLRSDRILEGFINKNNYLEKLYPDTEKQESALFAQLLKGFSVKILEPKPQVRDGYIGNPQRVQMTLKVKDESSGVALLNGYADYVNRQLVSNFQDNINEVIKGSVKVLTDRVATQRKQYQQQRLLTIKKMEHNDARSIAQLQEQITAILKKTELNRQTRIANATEALKMAKVLGIVNLSTVDTLAKKGMKSKSSGTSITVVDKQSVPLYLYGTKYLTMLIKTLKNRKDDEIFITKISTWREKIQLIQKDTVLAALKSRQSDDPWIPGLAEELAKIASIKQLRPDFTHVHAYTLDNPAIVTDKSVKPKRKLIVGLGFVLSLFIAIFVALVVGAKDRAK